MTQIYQNSQGQRMIYLTYYLDQTNIILQNHPKTRCGLSLHDE